ncbi:MAG: glycosyltransferase family 4 protein [Clostridia bacterium]|nr:glycosyltransferase family 4 protein [Clostridia bacterium]
MKLLFILSIGLDVPGPSVHILSSLFEELSKRHEVRVILKKHANGHPLPSSLEASGVSFQFIESAPVGKSNLAMRYIDQLRYVKKVSVLLPGNSDCDAVYVHSNTAQLAFCRAIRRHIKGAKLVLNVQDIFPENMACAGLISNRHPVYLAMSFMQHRAYRAADAVITLSDDMKRTIESSGAQNVEIIPLWSYDDEVSTVPESDNRVLREYPELKGRFLAVYAGNTGNMQNVEIILEAAKLLADVPSVSFAIVGDGVRLERLKAIKTANKLENVVFLPMQPNTLAPDVYSMAGVNLITLKKGVINTAFPSKTTTCLAVGRPIIACVDNDSNYADMIRELDNCRVVPCDDAKALAGAILAIRDSRAHISEKARKLYAERLTPSAGIAMHEALFTRLKGSEIRER